MSDSDSEILAIVLSLLPTEQSARIWAFMHQCIDTSERGEQFLTIDLEEEKALVTAMKAFRTLYKCLSRFSEAHSEGASQYDLSDVVSTTG